MTILKLRKENLFDRKAFPIRFSVDFSETVKLKCSGEYSQSAKNKSMKIKNYIGGKTVFQM
jgi:hypothetical protein